jgi:hypothetical protein
MFSVLVKSLPAINIIVTFQIRESWQKTGRNFFLITWITIFRYLLSDEIDFVCVIFIADII